MQRYLSLALPVLLALAPPGARSADPVDSALFHLEVKDAPAENGKLLNMEFLETARADNNSTVLVTRKSGGSVSSSMFVLRGMCGLARARGKQKFLPQAVAGQPGGYIVTFPDTTPPKAKGFSITQCDLIGF